MADRLYLSLWYPNFRLEALPSALAAVLHQFAMVGGKRVAAATAYPISFTEPPAYQRVYAPESRTPRLDTFSPVNPDPESAIRQIDEAVAEATEQLHEDMAYEFEMHWQLWTPDDREPAYNRLGLTSARDAPDPESDEEDETQSDAGALAHGWRPRTHTVRVLGFGPRFDVAGYEQNGHMLIDFGIDTPWIPDPVHPDPSLAALAESGLDETAQIHIQQNVEKLLAFTLLIEKNCGISSRLLWTESGEPLAEKLIARLQRVH
jgi:hypothetical protein